MIIMKDYPRGKIDGRREAYRKIEEMINETWWERDVILNKLDTTDKKNYLRQIFARIEKTEFRDLLKRKLHSLVNGQGQDTGDGQGFGSVETIGDVSDGNHLCRENKSEMGSEWSLSPDITWEEVIKKLEENEKETKKEYM